MTIECYKTECKYHSTHFGQEGPFCDEEECRQTTTTQEQKDQELIEWLGGCWHTWKGSSGNWFCPKCKEITYSFAYPPIFLYDLSTWKGFGWCWEKMPIANFISWLDDRDIHQYIWELKSPRERCNLLWEFKESRKDK
jgi:hypothetical protein